MNWLLTLHVLATVIWIGGMFFAHMALRQAAAECLEPPERLRLMHATLGRFFTWVWASIATLWLTGYWIIFGYHGGMGGTPPYVHAMMGIALVMTAIYAFIVFVPFRRLGHAVQRQAWPEAGSQLTLIRRLVTTNLVLGLVTTVIGTAKYLSAS